jgi:hypothetical protein
MTADPAVLRTHLERLEKLLEQVSPVDCARLECTIVLVALALNAAEKLRLARERTQALRAEVLATRSETALLRDELHFRVVHRGR